MQTTVWSYTTTHHIRSQDSSVSIVTRLWTGLGTTFTFTITFTAQRAMPLLRDANITWLSLIPLKCCSWSELWQTRNPPPLHTAIPADIMLRGIILIYTALFQCNYCSFHKVFINTFPFFL